ncbi:GtrA family protein [Pseudomonas sp. RIT-To-2]|uniref:GtrA family protein n=1 Tax=Pseudomonas sp. RIT-To-2 TaxID=3462541 RepID=UPI00241391A1
MFGLLFLKFAGAGLIGTGVHYITLISLVQIAGAGPVTGSLTGAIAGAIINYLLAYHYVFASDKKHSETASKYGVIATGAIILNTACMYAFVHWLSLNYLASQVLTSALSLGYSYAANSVWTFRKA